MKPLQNHLMLTLEFIGIQAKPTFAFYDVFKDQKIEEELKTYKDI